MRTNTPFRILLFLILIGLGFSACNSSAKKEDVVETAEPQGEIYSGDFIYTPDAAVLTGKTFIYGIAQNEKAKELGSRVEKIRNTENDIVPVTVRGILDKKPADAEGWDEILTITDIIEVSDTPVKPDIQLQ